MGKILIGIPVLYGAAHCKEAIDSVIYKEGVDVLLLSNGATEDVKELVKKYEREFANCYAFYNEVNVYVNPAWNFFIEFFNKPTLQRFLGGWSHLIIMNSDLILQSQWDKVVRNRWEVNHDEILLPVIDILHEVKEEVSNATKVTSGTPGVFITLNRKQSELIYPIPSEIRVWFGDNWIFEILRAKGYETLIPENLLAKHYWSSTVSKVPGISEIIEQDKLQWEIVKEKYLLPLISNT